MAATLSEAAGLASIQLYAPWLANTLQTRVAAFAAAAGAIVPLDESEEPIGDWAAVIASFAPSILASTEDGIDRNFGSITTYRTAVTYVHRICILGYELQQQGLFTTAQATALLAAYNTQFP